MSHIILKNTHPGLYKLVLYNAITHYLVGGLILYGSSRIQRHNPIMSWIFIGLFFVVGSFLLYGLYAPHYAWIRRGLIIGLMLIGFLGFVFTFSVGTTLNHEQTIRLAWLVPPWLFWATAHYIMMEEPPENPSSEIH